MQKRKWLHSKICVGFDSRMCANVYEKIEEFANFLEKVYVAPLRWSLDESSLNKFLYACVYDYYYSSVVMLCIFYWKTWMKWHES